MVNIQENYSCTRTIQLLILHASMSLSHSSLLHLMTLAVSLFMMVLASAAVCLALSLAAPWCGPCSCCRLSRSLSRCSLVWFLLLLPLVSLSLSLLLGAHAALFLSLGGATRTRCTASTYQSCSFANEVDFEARFLILFRLSSS